MISFIKSEILIASLNSGVFGILFLCSGVAVPVNATRVNELSFKLNIFILGTSLRSDGVRAFSCNQLEVKSATVSSKTW
mgnify:CR=1 FL=1